MSRYNVRNNANGLCPLLDVPKPPKHCGNGGAQQEAFQRRKQKFILISICEWKPKRQHKNGGEKSRDGEDRHNEDRIVDGPAIPCHHANNTRRNGIVAKWSRIWK
jgi:hypothetical protein